MRRAIISAVTLVLLTVANDRVYAASSFPDPMFKSLWEQGEAVVPNFWGPLANAKSGQLEPYKESPDGLRLVQYFDKGRMELTGQIVTSGLLAVSMKTGKLQRGDNTFEDAKPAKIGVAGDPNGGGPTYADLNTLPEKVDRTATGPYYDEFAGGKFTPGKDIKFGPTTMLYQGDPAGRYGEWVPNAFADFINRVPAGTVGYPIAPMVSATVRVAGISRAVIMQAFERRVLTLNIDTGPTPPTVEFGNIGQHFSLWRSLGFA